MSFSRIREAGTFRKRLEPGAFVYLFAIVRGELTLELQFPEEQLIRLQPGDVVSLSGMTQHILRSLAPAIEEPSGRVKAAGAAPQESIGRFDLLEFGERRFAGSPTELLIGVAPNEAMSLANMINGPLVIDARRDATYSRHIWKAFELLEDEFHDSPANFDRDQIIRRIAEIMSINVNRAISQRGNARMRSFTARRSKAYAQHMQGIWHSLSRFLESPFEPWPLARLASLAGMSRSAYCDSFRLATGMTPKRSIGRIRMMLVSQRLSMQRMPIEDAADLAGYGSSAAFIRAFQREFKITPAKWRASQR